ncbi:T9SS type A sorting domain-containing protein [candidate division KSB1 bacterium]|nr:T9SS type A sorting domain-containing protein [candidate division KSB1 bacterium]
MFSSTRGVLFLIFIFLITPCYSQLIQPEDLEYKGAFRLPEGSGGSDWYYSGNAMTYYPDGDSSGPNDGFPGSIFAIGHDHQQYVSEISIPAPVISSEKNFDELNTATTLQPFSDITGGMFGYLEMPTAGLSYLPPQGNQSSGKLYFCWGQHIQFQEVSHGWCELNLSNPQTAGPWHFGDFNNFTTSDYLFEIPKDWADANTPGLYMASGRFREGVWSGLGPALYAFAPWKDGNPPASNATLTSISRLLLYGTDDPNVPEIQTNESQKFNQHNYADQWTGACWLTAGENSAVVFIGTKGMGNGWYGFSDGTVWPYEGPYPPIPDPPHNERGYWADSIRAQILFYDPADLAAVVQGTKQSWEPQPYAVLDINDHLFDPGYDYWRQKMHLLGASCFDRERSLLYVFERRADDEKSIVHVWKVNAGSTGVKRNFHNLDFELFQNYPNPFNLSTTLTFQIVRKSDVNISISDILGRKIKVFVNKNLYPGFHSINWDGRNEMGNEVSSGLYFFRFEIGELISTRKGLLLK